MDEKGRFLASLLASARKSLAAGAANRQLQRGSPDTQSGARSFGDLREEAEGHLRQLEEALSVGSAELFTDHAAWLRDAYAARGETTPILEAGLACLREELEENLPLHTHALAFSALDAALVVVRAAPRPVESCLEQKGRHADLACGVLELFLEGRREEALERITTAADAGLSISELELDVIAFALREIGAMWLRGEVRIAEEHAASAIAAEALSSLRQRIPPAATGARKVVLASVGGNAHGLAPRIVADHFLLAGWKVHFLGADMPGSEVIWAADEFRCDLVALSAALPLHVRATAELIAELRAKHPKLPVLIGGGPFQRVPDLWRKVGADAWAEDAPRAVEEGERLVPPRPE